MIDPITVTLISLAITQLVHLIISIHQSVKSRHFQSSCGLSSCIYDSEHQDNQDNKDDNK